MKKRDPLYQFQFEKHPKTFSRVNVEFVGWRVVFPSVKQTKNAAIRDVIARLITDLRAQGKRYRKKK